MRDFIIDCLEDLVRILPFRRYQLGEGKGSFRHVCGYLMEGHTTGQKAQLSKNVFSALKPLFPKLSILFINIADFKAAAYCNKVLLHPENHARDRHFLNDLERNIPRS